MVLRDAHQPEALSVTDHGHGGITWVIGGNGGKIYGEWPGLAPGNTYQNRDLLVSTGFQTIFSEVLHDHLKLHPSKRIFPGFTDTKRLNLFAT